MGSFSHCSVDEYIDGDNCLPTCVDIDGEDWDESWTFLLMNQNPHPLAKFQMMKMKN